ncbi:hypothetical protein FNYG_15770 [Fusarium nygamai]|uniref:Nephrocystin 3-like N-terminal domain-containing protein n=1 Tax=Gibberella nygamai TaxID=42673 RepID=A0A2K0U676_GIBNY|nr:hypothetical protein FNYG_15770 [Fusarium nygamai]
MGGLVVKKALIIAHGRADIYGTISDSTVGIIFLATPHRGSGIAAPAELASRLLHAAQLGTGTNTKLVTSLRQNAEVLWDISSQFVDRASRIHIRSFYETDLLPPGNSLIVDRNSAVLHHPKEVAMPMLNTNHRTISRFSHTDCQNYALVREALQDIHSKVISKDVGLKSPDEATTRITQQFHKSSYVEYKASIKPPINETCVWFPQETQFVHWLQNPSPSLLWISGDPGCGKTTLAAFLTDSINQHLFLQDIIFTPAYFFFDGNIAAQDNGTALLFALIHQLLQANPTLAPLAKKHLALNNAQFRFSLHSLCEIFRVIVSSPERSPGGIVCVVDALDECDAASMNIAIRFLASMIFDDNNIANKGRWLKLAVTSRYTQPIDDLFRTFPAHYQIRLADYVEQTTRDIETFVRARCAHVQTVTRCSDTMRRAVEKQLVERSDNTFLWIHMVLDLLETSTDATPRSFESTLQSIPDRLDGLYDNILRRSAAPESLLRILSIIAASRRVLTLDEINIALEIRSDDSLICEVQQRCQLDIARHLYAVCGPFIRIRNGTVTFIHQTAVEFLMRTPGVPRSHIGDGRYQYKACLDVKAVNYCLAEICIVYLMLTDGVSNGPLSDHDADGDVMDTGEGDFDTENQQRLETTRSITRQRERSEGLLDYAAKHWGTHCRLGKITSSTAGQDNHILFTKVIGLCDTSTSIFCAWFQLYWDTISTAPPFPDGLTPLMLASHMGLLGIMHTLLSDGERENNHTKGHLRVTDSEGWTALHWAVWNGQASRIDDAVIELLLQQCSELTEEPINDNEEGLKPEQKGQTIRTVTPVLDIQDKNGLTALHWAAADDQEGVMRLLLDAGAAVDVVNADGMTPLSLAVQNEFLGPVELLIKYGADINAAEVIS